MFADLNRLKIGQGLIRYYPYKKGLKSLAILIRNAHNFADEKKAALEQLHNHFCDINGATVDKADLNQSPIIYNLDADTNVAIIADTAVQLETPKQLLICDDWASYAALCRALNITRSDHFRLAAELGYEDEGVETESLANRPKSYLKQIITAVQRRKIGVIQPEFLFDDAFEKYRKNLNAVCDYVEGFLQSSYRHIYAEMTDIAHDEVIEIYDGWDFYMPQPLCVFEIPLMDSYNTHMFVFAKETNDNATGFDTLRITYTADLNELVMHPVGSRWMPGTTVEDFYSIPWVNPLPMLYGDINDPEGLSLNIAIEERNTIFPVLAQLNDMRSKVKRYNHPVLKGSTKKAVPRDYYVFRAQDIRRNQASAYDEKKQRPTSFSRAGSGIALHPVDAHMRRPSGSLPHAEKTIKVKAHSRGDERFGISNRMLIKHRTLKN